MKIILLGPPGAGKGTQAEKIVDRYGVAHISTGDIFRKNLRENTPLGLKAKEYMDKGLLVPDEVTVEMLKDRLLADDCKKGFMLDGFPRTIAQAEALENIVDNIDCALDISVDYDALTERIVGRRMCKSCGASYNITFMPPQKDGVCDRCGGELYQRDDDKAETVKARLKEYDEKTLPLTEYYSKKGILKQVDGNKEMQDVTKQIYSILDSFK